MRVDHRRGVFVLRRDEGDAGDEAGAAAVAMDLHLLAQLDRGEIGFLNDTRRMNVALTRARRKLIVIGDSATLASHPFFDRLIKHFENHSAYGSVWEFGFAS